MSVFGGRHGLSLSIITAHTFLVCAFGNAYGKIALPIGIKLYPTEVALFLALLTGASAIRDVPWDRITKLVLLFDGFGVFWIAATGVGDLASAGAKAASFFVYSVLYFLVRGTATDDRRRWAILRAVCVASVIGAAIGLWQMQTGTSLLRSSDEFEVTSTGTLRWLGGDFAMYGVFTGMITLAELINRRPSSRSTLLFLAAAAIEIALAQHRSAFVALAIALGASLMLLGGSLQALQRLFRIAIILAVAIIIVGYLFGSGYLEDTVNRLQHTGDMEDVNINWRLLSWYEVFDGVKAQPLGHGFAVWSFLFNMTDPLTGSHNSLLDLAYRIGVPGLIAFLAIPVTFIRDVRNRIQLGQAGDRVLLVICCGCVVAHLIYASFNVVLETPYLSIFFWLFLGLGAGAINEKAQSA